MTSSVRKLFDFSENLYQTRYRKYLDKHQHKRNIGNIWKRIERGMYNTTEAATLLGVTRQTVARYVRQGILEAKFLGLKHAIRIPEDALQKFVAEQGITLIGKPPTITKKP